MDLDDLLAHKLRAALTLEQSAAILEHLLNGGYSVTPDGRLYNTRELVGRVNGLRIVIYPVEHPPPHFHVIGPDFEASFRIEDGQFENGTISRTQRRLIAKWYEGARPVLVRTWNETRPTDCPVGPIQDTEA